jgi:quercetin dioxygenase-like cupin family protein
VKEANENVLVIPILESVTGLNNLQAMLNVPGVDLFFFGPSDYSSSAGFAGQWEGPGVAEKILAAKERIRGAGRHCGVIATGTENLQQRFDQGFRMLAIGLDGGLLIRSMRRTLAGVGRDRPLVTALTADAAPPSGASGRSPSRHKAPAHPAAGSSGPPAADGSIVLAPGVRFQPQLGPDAGTAGLTTGLVTLEGGAGLPYHRQDYAESLTLLAGRALVEVDGRMYTLEPLDAIMIPPGLPHAAANRSADEPARFHVAMATGNPRRIPVEPAASRKAMPRDTAGTPGAERIIRTPRPGP